MQCAAVISVTIQNGTGNQELIAGSGLLDTKYGEGRSKDKQPTLFINILAESKNYEMAIEANLADHMETLLGMVKEGRSIGLYWAIHGNQDCTDPDIKSLVVSTADLYGRGLRFKKINLSACHSAGPRKDNKPFDYSQSMLSKFCTGLSGLVEAELIKDLMVAGYRSCIVMYDHDSDDPYFKSLRSNKENKFDPKLEGAGVRNTFVDFGQKGGKYETTHPKGLSNDAMVELQQYAGRRDRLDDLNKVANKKAGEQKEFKTLSQQVGPRSQTTESKKLYDAVQNYVAQKWCLKFSGNNWVRVPLSEYTENQSIRDMVALVPLAKDGTQMGAFILPK